MMFIKYAAVQLQQLGLKKQMDLFNNKQPGGKDAKEAIAGPDSVRKREQNRRPQLFRL